VSSKDQLNFVSSFPSLSTVIGKFFSSMSSIAASQRLMRSTFRLGLYIFLPGACVLRGFWNRHLSISSNMRSSPCLPP
jgi:hypothetical protein